MGSRLGGELAGGLYWLSHQGEAREPAKREKEGSRRGCCLGGKNGVGWDYRRGRGDIGPLIRSGGQRGTRRAATIGWGRQVVPLDAEGLQWLPVLLPWPYMKLDSEDWGSSGRAKAELPRISGNPSLKGLVHVCKAEEPTSRLAFTG